MSKAKPDGKVTSTIRNPRLTPLDTLIMPAVISFDTARMSSIRVRRNGHPNNMDQRRCYSPSLRDWLMLRRIISSALRPGKRGRRLLLRESVRIPQGNPMFSPNADVRIEAFRSIFGTFWQTRFWKTKSRPKATGRRPATRKPADHRQKIVGCGLRSIRSSQPHAPTAPFKDYESHVALSDVRRPE